MHVADNIYYNALDGSGTSTSFSNNTLALKMVGKYGTTEVVKEIQACPRPNFYR
jgi:hypothetical protein